MWELELDFVMGDREKMVRLVNKWRVDWKKFMLNMLRMSAGGSVIEWNEGQ